MLEVSTLFAFRLSVVLIDCQERLRRLLYMAYCHPPVAIPLAPLLSSPDPPDLLHLDGTQGAGHSDPTPSGSRPINSGGAANQVAMQLQ